MNMLEHEDQQLEQCDRLAIHSHLDTDDDEAEQDGTWATILERST